MRKWFFFLGSLLFVFLLPYLLSTPIFKPLIVRTIHARYHLNVTLHKARFSWLGPQVFHDLSWENATVEEISIDAPFWHIKGPMQFRNAHLQVGQVNGSWDRENLTVKGDHISIEGKFESTRNFDLAFNLQEFPLNIPALGEALTIQGTVQPQRLDLEIKTPNLQTHLIGRLVENGLILIEPLVGALHITHHLIPNIESKTQTLFKIDAKEAFFPYPFSLDALRCTGQIDLGQIAYESDRLTATLISLLKAELPQSTIDLWFAPVDFGMQKGLLTLDRLDFLLADTLPLCTWGTIKHNSLHLTLGLPFQTLHRAFGINNVNQDYVLTAPITGTIDDPSINKKEILAKITLITSMNKVPTRGMVSKVTPDAIRSEANIPPAHHPLPWEK